MTPPVFAHGHLRLYLLSLLDERPQHGYELIQSLGDRFGGTYVPSAGTIYPRLGKLQEEGLVTKQSDGRRTVYAITDAGRAELAARREELAAIETDVTDSVRRLADEVRDRVIAGLAATPGAFSVLARQGGDVAGFANCLTGFSTFAAKPVINIHDFGVMPGHRGRGIGRKLLAAIESEAKKRGACKVTLEVLSGNEPARALYRSCGFGNYALDPAAGTAQFWEKKLA